jgi:hypothetical protein
MSGQEGMKRALDDGGRFGVVVTKWVMVMGTGGKGGGAIWVREAAGSCRRLYTMADWLVEDGSLRRRPQHTFVLCSLFLVLGQD